MVSRWFLWLSTLADPITEWWNVGPGSFAFGPRDFWGATRKSHRAPLVTVERLASYLWLPGKSALAQGLVLVEQPGSIALLKSLWGVFFYFHCIWNYLIDACKFLNVTHDSLKSRWESWRNCSLSAALSVTEGGQCHFLRSPLSSYRGSELPLSWPALYSALQGDYQWIRSSVLVFEAFVPVFFFPLSLTFYFTSSLLREWMTHLEVKKNTWTA